MMTQLHTAETPVESTSQPLSPSQQQAILAPAEVEGLLEQLQREATRRRARRRVKRLVIGGYLAFVVISLLIHLVMESRFSIKVPFIQLVWVLGGFGAVSKLQKEGVRKLAKNPDLRGVGYFVDALEYDDKDVVKEAKEALLVLLPELKASDAHLLNEEQRIILLKCLKNEDTTLVLAILKALEQVGDEKAVPFVDELAHRRSDLLPFSQIRVAAQACLPALKARVEQQMAARTLLRATESGSDSSVLLRPAANSDTPAETLLRPSENQITADEQPNTVV